MGFRRDYESTNVEAAAWLAREEEPAADRDRPSPQEIHELEEDLAARRRGAHDGEVGGRQRSW